MILPIKISWIGDLLPQQNLAQINKDNIRKNNKRVDHDYKVGDKVMLANKFYVQM